MSGAYITARIAKSFHCPDEIIAELKKIANAQKSEQRMVRSAK